MALPLARHSHGWLRKRRVTRAAFDDGGRRMSGSSDMPGRRRQFVDGGRAVKNTSYAILAIVEPRETVTSVPYRYRFP